MIQCVTGVQSDSRKGSGEVSNVKTPLGPDEGRVRPGRKSPNSEFHTIDVLLNITRDQHSIGTGRTRPDASWERGQVAFPSQACLLQFPLDDRDPGIERCAPCLRRAGDARACSGGCPITICIALLLCLMVQQLPCCLFL